MRQPRHSIKVETRQKWSYQTTVIWYIQTKITIVKYCVKVDEGNIVGRFFPLKGTVKKSECSLGNV